MDTSETYIKMRRKAIPDLGMGTKPEADIMVNAGRDLSLEHPLILRVETYKRISDDVWSDLKGDYYCDGDAGACQLERQDQLQEMVTSQDLAHYEVINPNEPPLIDNLLSAFQQFSNKQPWMGKADTIGNRPSMEQLWLAFVMKELYSKHWNGEDWVKA